MKTKNIIFIIVGSVCSILFLYYSILYFVKNLENATLTTSILNLISTIVGGIVGGIIAFAIARFQIEENNKKELLIQQEKTKNILILIKDELSFNKKIINISQEEFEDEIEVIKKTISSAIWEKVLTEPNITTDLIGNINICYRNITMIKVFDKENLDYHVLETLRDDINHAVQYIDLKTSSF